MNQVLRIGLLLFALVLMAWLIWDRDPPPAPGIFDGPQGESPAPDPLPATRLSGQEGRDLALETSPFDADVSDDEAAHHARRMGGIKGRCIDASTGEPLAGLNVSLRGWVGNSQRAEAHEREFGPVSWTNPDPIVTNAEGAWRFEFDPPPPYQYSIALELPTHVAPELRIHRLPAAKLVDLGPIPMKRGTMVSGRLREESGAGIAPARIAFIRKTKDFVPSGERRPADRIHTATEPDGSFATPAALAAGDWRIVVKPHRPVKETVVEFEATGGARTFDLVVERVHFDPLRTVAIEGRVASASGQPIDQAKIGILRPRFGVRWEADSASNGDFRIEQLTRGDPREVRLLVKAEGYMSTLSDDLIEWESSETLVVLEPSATVDLVARDERSGEGLHDLVVWGDPGPSTDRRTKTPACSLLARGKFADQKCTIRPPWPESIITVRDLAGRYETSRPITLDTSSGTHHQLEVELTRLNRRVVRIVDERGQPVAGSRVELLKRSVPGQAITIKTRPRPANQPTSMMGSNVKPAPIGVRSLKTNALGEVQFEGHPDEDHALRVMGPGHVAQVIQNFSIQSDQEPLVVEVQRGGVLYGTLVSGYEYLGEASLPPDWDLVPEPPSFYPDPSGPGLFLRSADREGVHRRCPATVEVPVAPDGTYRIEGVPAGTWHLQGMRRMRRREGIGTVSSSVMIRERITMAPGEHKQLNLDLGSRLPAILHGRVTLNGEPLTNQILHFYFVARGPNEKAPSGAIANFITDDEGRFSKEQRPGEWRLSLLPTGDRVSLIRPSGVLLPKTVRVLPNQDLEVNFAIEACKQPTIVVMRPDGVTPAAGVLIMQRATRWEQGLHWPETDANGVSRLELIHAGSHDIFALLRSDEGRSGPSKAVSLGTIAVKEDHQRFVLQLP